MIQINGKQKNLAVILHRSWASCLCLTRRCWLLVCIPVRPLASEFAHHCGACQALLWHHSCQQLSGLHKMYISWQDKTPVNSMCVVLCTLSSGPNPKLMPWNCISEKNPYRLASDRASDCRPYDIRDPVLERIVLLVSSGFQSPKTRR